MAQTDKTTSLQIAQDSEIYGFDEGKALSTSYANVLVVNVRKVKSTTIILRLDDVAIDGDYQIFASCKRDANLADVTTDDWFPYKAATSLVHEVNAKEVITERYFWIVVQAKADSGTPTLKAWYRGTN